MSVDHFSVGVCASVGAGSLGTDQANARDLREKARHPATSVRAKAIRPRIAPCASHVDRMATILLIVPPKFGRTDF